MQSRRFILLLAASAVAATTARAQNPSQFQWLNANSSFISNTRMPTPLVNPDGPFVVAGDVDGDQDVDFISGYTFVENTTAKSANGPHSDYDTLTVPAGCSLINPFISPLTDGALADLNGDGFPELIAGSSTNGSLGIWANIPGTCSKRRFDDARSTASGSWTYPFVASGFQALVVADFDGDGMKDIVWGGTGGITFHPNLAGSGTSRNFPAGTVSLPTLSIETLAAADFDGDGDLDLALGGGTIGAPVHALALNSGLGKFTLAVGAIPAVAGFPLSVAAADVDADGDTDLVYGHQAVITLAGAITEGGIAILSNNGAGLFGAPQVLTGGVSFTGISVGDVDEDGFADILGCTRQEAGTVGGTTITTPNGTHMFDAPAAGAAFADVSLARIGSDLAARPFQCVDPTNPLADAIDPGTCLPLDATGIVLADYDLDLDLDIVLSYRLGDRIGVFANLLWQLETARVSNVQSLGTNSWQWNVAYDLFCEFNVPNFGGAGGLGVVAVSLTPPTHVFPAGSLGVLTTGNYVTGPTTLIPGGQGQFVMPLGPFTTAEMLNLVGTKLFSTAGILSFGRNVVRLTKVTETTLQ